MDGQVDGREGAGAVPSSASLQGIPDHVARCLTTALEAARNPEATRDAESERAARAAAAEVIQAARAVQAWAESVETAGTRALLRSVEEDCAINLGQSEPRSSRQTRLREARRATVAELGLLTGLSQTQCQERVALASATVARAGYLRQRMEGGTVSAHRAITLNRETSHLDPLTADDITRRALVPLDGEPTSRDDPGSFKAEVEVVAGALPLSQGTFRRRLKRQLTKAESAAGVAERKTTEHEDARDVRTDDGNFGMATTWIEATRDRAYAAQERVDAIARSARQAGDERTLRQLRSDVATDLLIHGTVPGDQILGAPPAARLNVSVGLATLLPDAEAGPTDSGVRTGADTHDSDAPGEVPGLGFLTPDQVRRIALTAGATWRRVVTDPVTESRSRRPRPTGPLRRCASWSSQETAPVGRPAARSRREGQTSTTTFRGCAVRHCRRRAPRIQTICTRCTAGTIT